MQLRLVEFYLSSWYATSVLLLEDEAEPDGDDANCETALQFEDPRSNEVDHTPHSILLSRFRKGTFNNDAMPLHKVLDRSHQMSSRVFRGQ
jgi:hypothetical protein